MSVDAAADLFALLSELEDLGRRDDADSEGADDWIDPVSDGQLALDQLGAEMRRAVMERASDVGD